MPGRLPRHIIFAPGVHTGGGLVLLQALLEAASGKPYFAFLDRRARDLLPEASNAKWIEQTPAGRIRAECELSRYSRIDDTILCFHSLPPLLRSRARVKVYVQNKILIDGSPLKKFQLRTRTRLMAERLLGAALRPRVAEYVVQTESMRRAVASWCEDKVSIRIVPFVMAPPETKPQESFKYDFIYPALDLPHKNHDLILTAWGMLRDEGLFPTLAVTLPRDSTAWQKIKKSSDRLDLRITTLGMLDRPSMFDAYRSARALLFASEIESFGLPLVEATQVGLPVVAPERDYVRDVCQPVETFDPTSAVSLARAVKRYLGSSEKALTPLSGDEAWSKLLEE